jgi:hypothetical protein
LIELAFIGLYSDDGKVSFFRPDVVPPSGVPRERMAFSQTLELVKKLHAKRNPKR